jgi:Tol biopolymer transport system component
VSREPSTRTLLAVLLAAFAFALLPGPGAATVPGKPGLIAFVTTKVVSTQGVYSVRPDGTGRTRLPSAQIPTTPAVSPDGTRIAWAGDDSTLWVAEADGTGAHSLGAPGFSPSFSPDGTQIAVSLLNDGLSIVDAASGAARQVTANVVSGPPHWSPDGAWIAYVGRPQSQGPVTPNDALRIVRPDGSDDHVLVRNFDANRTVIWSPDGTRLALSTNALELVDLNGKVTTYPSEQIAGPVAWSPDGRKIAYGGFAVPCRKCKEALTVLDLADGELTRLAPNGYSPAWSRDGRLLAYVGEDEALRVVDAAGGKPRKVADRVGGATVALAWTADGRIVYQAQENDVHALALVPSSGGTARLLLPSTAGAQGRPAWSPDGKRLVFARNTASVVSVIKFGTSDCVLEVADADGSHVHPIPGARSNVDSPDPAWSPDGRELAYVRDDGVYVVATAGGTPRLVAKGANPWSPVWSPDGRLIAFGDGIYIDNGRLEVVRPDGSGRRVIRSGLRQDERIDWSPDGRLLAIVRSVDAGSGYDESKLYTATLAGKPTGIWGRDVDDPSWSPDGSRMAVSDPVAVNSAIAPGATPTSLEAPGTGVITVIAPDGTRTSLGAVGSYPAWQPLPGRQGAAG